MEKLVIAAAVCVGLTGGVASLVHAQTLTSNAVGLLETLDCGVAMVNALPAPADDPLLDASGNVVVDAFGNPVSDPNETFHQVKPGQYDPAHTYLVQAAWLNGTGCPTNAAVAVYPATSPTDTFTDAACPGDASDPKDQHNEGLLMVKTGPTGNNAAAVAELKKVKGLTLFELGYDIRKTGIHSDAAGSHCGAGAPRFNVVTTDGFFGVGCSSPPPTFEQAGEGWIRLRWGGNTAPLMGFLNFATLMPITGTVQRIQIVFDEGQDASGAPDTFGAAVLDNIDVNGMLVGHGATDAR
jgi:hypothetical protein